MSVTKTMAHEYAQEQARLAAAQWRWSGAYDAVAAAGGASQFAYTQAYDRASHAMTWCQVRKIEFASAEEAIATMKAETVQVLHA